MTETLQATRRFRLKIMALMLKPGWLSKYHTVLQPEYFESQDETDVVASIMDYFSQYGYSPSSADDLIDLVGTRKYNDLIASIYLGVHDWDLSHASDRIIEFARQQAAKHAVLNSLPDIQSGKLANVVARMQLAMKVGQDLTDLGLDVKRDPDSWINSAKDNRIPTGIIHLDIAMDGGLAIGELGIILSPPNYGKSMALINIGYGAMGPIARCKVVHFTFEMGADVVARRYGARTIFRFPSRSGNNLDYKVDFQSTANVLLPGEVRVFRLNGNINDIRARLDVLIENGYMPDLIIVDYGDEIDPIKARNNRYNELGDIFGDLRKVAFDYNCPLWTATQATRGALGKETITMADLAESFKKAAKADAIIAICQTMDEESVDQCRLFVAKLRDGKSRAMIRCKYYKEQQAIVSTEFVHRGGNV